MDTLTKYLPVLSRDVSTVPVNWLVPPVPAVTTAEPLAYSWEKSYSLGVGCVLTVATSIPSDVPAGRLVVPETVMVPGGPGGMGAMSIQASTPLKNVTVHELFVPGESIAWQR